MPKSLGGKGDGNNPEQLFALGYSSCFLSALNLVAGQEKITLPSNVACEAHVSIGPPSQGPKPFAIAVDLIITSDASSSEEKKKLQEAVEKAHEVSEPGASLQKKGVI
jgi:osmotically inducible protein OsmC